MRTKITRESTIGNLKSLKISLKQSLINTSFLPFGRNDINSYLTPFIMMALKQIKKPQNDISRLSYML